MKQIQFLDRLVIRSIFHALRDYAVELGYYPDTSIYENPNDPVAIADFKNKLRLIKSNKGFWIDFFSESSSRNKGEKEAPRIVVSLDRSFNGDIGAPPNQIFKKAGGEDFYQAGIPGLSSNLIAAVYLITHNSEQTYILNGIKDNVLGERKYLKYHGLPDKDPFYIYRTGYYNLDEPTENITERAYLYTTPDAFLGEEDIYRETIKPIKEITVCTNTNDVEPDCSDNLIVPKPQPPLPGENVFSFEYEETFGNES